MQRFYWGRYLGLQNWEGVRQVQRSCQAVIGSETRVYMDKLGQMVPMRTKGGLKHVRVPRN